MSYDLAVWIGARPLDAEAAGEEYERRCEEVEELDPAEEIPPAPALQAFAADLLVRYPEAEVDEDESPWSMSPLIGDAIGDFFPIAMTYPGAARARAFVIETIRRHQLVGYDPQTEELL
jgi:hypothetical protein